MDEDYVEVMEIPAEDVDASAPAEEEAVEAAVEELAPSNNPEMQQAIREMIAVKGIDETFDYIGIENPLSSQFAQMAKSRSEMRREKEELESLRGESTSAKEFMANFQNDKLAWAREQLGDDGISALIREEIEREQEDVPEYVTRMREDNAKMMAKLEAIENAKKESEEKVLLTKKEKEEQEQQAAAYAEATHPVASKMITDATEMPQSLMQESYPLAARHFGEDRDKLISEGIQWVIAQEANGAAQRVNRPLEPAESAYILKHWTVERCMGRIEAELKKSAEIAEKQYLHFHGSPQPKSGPRVTGPNTLSSKTAPSSASGGLSPEEFDNLPDEERRQALRARYQTQR